CKRMVFARLLDKIKLGRRVWRERTNIQLLFDTGNYRFIEFAPPGHFYSPIPDIKEVDAHSCIVFDRLPTKIPGIDLNTEAQITLAREFAAYYGDIPFPEKQQNGSRYHLDNSYFSYGDGVVLYSVMRRFKPKRVIEVGSGFSSAAMLDVN